MALSNKNPKERVVITFDFSAVPEAISNPLVSITEKGSDIELPSMMIDVPQIVGNKVLQLFKDGEDQVAYTVSCLVDVVSTGERFLAKDTLNVKI